MSHYIRGNTTKLVASFLISAFSFPGNLIEQVAPLIDSAMTEFSDPYVGFSIFKVF